MNSRLLLLEEQLPAVVKPHQNHLLQEKELKNKEIKSHKPAFPAVIQDIELSCPAQPVGSNSWFCIWALEEAFAGK